MKKIYLVPRAGLKVPDPEAKDHLPPEGREVVDSPYWRRRLKTKEVEIRREADPPAAPVAPAEPETPPEPEPPAGSEPPADPAPAAEESLFAGEAPAGDPSAAKAKAKAKPKAKTDEEVDDK